MKFKSLRSENRQKGLALILAIGLLLVLSILGAVVMKVSLEDFKRSSTFNPQREAFYVADRTVEYAMNRDIIYSLMTPGVPLDLAAGSHKATIEQDSRGATLDSGEVVMLAGDFAMPDQLAELHGSDFGVVMYHVNAKSSYAAFGGAEAKVDASIVRLFKKDDDQIFRTSGGG